MDATKVPATPKQPPAPRRPYRPPRLLTHGTVAAITAAAPSPWAGVGYAIF